MNYSVSRNNNVGIISSEVDKINGTNAYELRDLITTLNNDNINNIIIDLSKTSYCDSSGLSAILLANRLCKNSDGQFTLVGLQSNVQKLIEISQLHRVLDIKENVVSAKKEM